MKKPFVIFAILAICVTLFVLLMSTDESKSNSSLSSTNPLQDLTSAPYVVGDYYNDGDKQGIVFEISADSIHGKIVNLHDLGETTWHKAHLACKNLGEGWHLPSMAEWESMLQNKSTLTVALMEIDDESYFKPYYWTSDDWNFEPTCAFFVGTLKQGFTPSPKSESRVNVRAVHDF